MNSSDKDLSQQKGVPNNPELAEWDSEGLVRPFEDARRCVDAANIQIGHYVAGTYLPAKGQLLQLGSGTGDLLGYLPKDINQRTVHTEPSPRLLEKLRAKHPQARAELGSAYAIDAEDGTIAGAYGLAFFDVLEDPKAARNELHRVLPKGGRFVHLLDAGVHLPNVLKNLQKQKRVPLINVTKDKYTMAKIGELAQYFPATKEGDDFFTISYDDAQILHKLLLHNQKDYTTTTTIGQYMQIFYLDALQDDYDAIEASRMLAALTDGKSNNEQYVGFSRDLARIFATIQHPQMPNVAVGTVNTTAQFEQMLEDTFSRAAGFKTVYSGLETRRAVQKRPPELDADIRYVKKCLGDMHSNRRLDASQHSALTETINDTSKTAGGILLANTGDILNDYIVCDSTMHLFVTEKQ